MSNLRAGRIEFKIDGQRLDAKGSFTYGLGQDSREAVIGSDGVHGFKATPQVAFIEGEITDHPLLSYSDLVRVDGVTVTLRLGNQKSIILNEAWFAGEGQGQTEDANLAVRFESRLSATEMKSALGL